MITWEQLEKTCNSCSLCQLCKTRQNVVLGFGNRNIQIMFVGEGPGYYEDCEGKPFVGKAGQLLDKIFKSIDITRENVYITNVVKCRPPNNRDPLPKEQDACLNYLRYQFLLIKPKIVVCLGRISAKALIHEYFKITKDHGKWFKKKNVDFIATFHPSALLIDEEKNVPHGKILNLSNRS